MRWRSRAYMTGVAVMGFMAAAPAYAADGDGPTDPAGIGDLFVTPNLKSGDSPTLFESFHMTAFVLDQDAGHGFTNVAGPATIYLNMFAELLMLINVALVRATIAVAWWVLGGLDLPELSNATSDMIGSASAELSGWLLPSALAIGGVIAYAQHRSASGSGMSQLAWTITSALIAVSFIAGPQYWVRGADTIRTIGNDAVMSATSAAVSGNNTLPFALDKEPTFTGSTRDNMLRKSGDAIWRAYTVTPWCIAEFGSLEACKRYGAHMLNLDFDLDNRKDYIWGDIADAEGGDKAKTVQWTAGNSPSGRVGVLFAADISAAIFALLVIGLAFFSLMAFLGTLLMLIAGLVFAMLWCIPGAPRQWGRNWFHALVGLVIQSILNTLIFGSVLVLTTATFTLMDSAGWLPVVGLTIALAISAWNLRRLLGAAVSAAAPGGGRSALMGYAAMRGLGRMFGSRGRTPRPSARPQQRQPQGTGEGGPVPTGVGGPRGPKFRQLGGPGQPRALSGPPSPEGGSRRPRNAGPDSEGYRPDRRPGPQRQKATAGAGASRDRKFRQYPAPGQPRSPQVVKGEVVESRTDNQPKRRAAEEARTPRTRAPRGQRNRPTPSRRKEQQ